MTNAWKGMNLQFTVSKKLREEEDVKGNEHELDQKVAIEIMKWKPHYQEGNLISFMTTDDKLLFFSEHPNERDWKPSLDLFQAYQVIENLRQDDVFIDVKCDVDGYWLSVYKEGTFYEFKNRVSMSELPKEICQIALKSLQIQLNSHTIVLTSVIHQKG